MSKEQTSQDIDPKGIGRNENFIRSRKRFKAYTWKYSRTISPFGSFILLVSQIFGFGMNGIPSVMREGGWLPALFANLGICITAALCSLMLLRSMTLIPHNENFDQRIEYNTLVKYYLSDFTFKVVSCLHHIGDLCSIICGILTFSKLLDMLLVRTLGCTFALQIYPRVGFFKVDLHLVGQIYEMKTFDSAVFAVTLGYVVCALVCLRLSACALEETMGFHRITFAVMIGCILQLCISSLRRIRGDETAFFPPPRVGRYSFYDTLLTFVENYSVASTTPAWANEMTAQVRVAPTMWLSSLFACGIYHALGYLLCVAFPANSGSVVRDVLMASSGLLTNSCICLFVAVTVLPDVVFGCISTRYNLLNLGYCRETVAYLWGCVFPFLFTWTMSNESLFMDVINHMALISALVCDFVIPTVLYLVASQLNDFSMTFDADSKANPFRHAGTILFSKLDTLKRKITGEISASNSAEMTCTVTLHKQPTGTVQLADYASFKIIKPPKEPRSDDHLYNVLEPRKNSRLKYDAEYYLDVAENEPGSCPPSNRNKSSPRVRVFPLESFAQQGAIVAYVMVIALTCLTLGPPVLRVSRLLH